MHRSWWQATLSIALALSVSACRMTPTHADAEPAAATPAVAVDCRRFGPQTPRDIDQPAGSNRRVFALAPAFARMNLCNLHVHAPAEHKAHDFSLPASAGGFRCNASASLSAAELAPVDADICGGLAPGDTIEAHWVYSSCDVRPGATLGACSSPACANPQLRVETQVFTLVNDPAALDFNDFSYDQTIVDGYHQAKALPQGTGTPVSFLGSTTGPDYNERVCSPLQVSWSVRPQCAKLDIHSLARWCEHNPFDEHHAHGVRRLVVDPAQLSTIE